MGHPSLQHQTKTPETEVSGVLIMTISQSRRSLHLPALPAADSQLASSVASSVSAFRSSSGPPGSQLPTFIGRRFPGASFRPSSNSSSANPPTCIGDRVLWLRCPTNFRPNLPSILRLCQRPTSDFHRVLASSAVPAIHFRLTARSSVEGTIGAPNLCTQVQIL